MSHIHDVYVIYFFFEMNILIFKQDILIFKYHTLFFNDVPSIKAYRMRHMNLTSACLSLKRWKIATKSRGKKSLTKCICDVIIF